MFQNPNFGFLNLVKEEKFLNEIREGLTKTCRRNLTSRNFPQLINNCEASAFSKVLGCWSSPPNLISWEERFVMVATEDYELILAGLKNRGFADANRALRKHK